LLCNQELRPREIPPGVFGVCLGAKSNEKDEVVVEIFVRIEIACIHAVYRMLMKKLEGTIKGQVGVPPLRPILLVRFSGVTSGVTSVGNFWRNVA
jgi:hypothetical protein